MKNKALIDLLKKYQILKYGHFKLKSGEHSTFYCDIKQTFGNPKILNQIISRIHKLIPASTTAIACSGYGGITLASIIAFKMKLPLVLVRDTVKEHGTKKTIDGYIPDKKDRVCIVDDVFTKGTSITDTKAKLKVTKCTFTKAVVVLDRSKRREVLSVLKYDELII